MNKYSPISKIMIKNFQNIDELVLDFSKSPIIALVGDNESGKTSAIKAFSVCSLHHNPRGQNEYIRDNTNMFGVAIQLADGTLVVRQKDQSINAYRVIKDNKVIWESAKITDGLPSIIQDIMGMVAEPETKEYLQIRSYEDKLLFVVTPASVNYKVMYNSLKVEQLTRAIKIGNTEVNATKSQVAANEIAFDTLHSQLSDLQVLDLEQASIVKERLSEGLKVISKMDRAMSLKSRQKQAEDAMGVVRIIDTYGLQEIPSLMIAHLTRASNVLERYRVASKLFQSFNDVESLNEVDYSDLNRMNSVREKVKESTRIKKECDEIEKVESMDYVDTQKIASLNKIRDKVQRMGEISKQLGVIDISSVDEISTDKVAIFRKLEDTRSKVLDINRWKSDMSTLESEIDRLNKLLINAGVEFETCPNCGTQVMIDLGKIKQEVGA